MLALAHDTLRAVQSLQDNVPLCHFRAVTKASQSREEAQVEKQHQAEGLRSSSPRVARTWWRVAGLGGVCVDVVIATRCKLIT